MKVRLSRLANLILAGSILAFGTSCQQEEPEQNKTFGPGEPISRGNDERLAIPPPKQMPPPLYPWSDMRVSHLPMITKEFFRCKGSPLNPERAIERNGKTERISDCGGTDRHSLPLKEDREFIYPILITLLNHVQSKTQKRVVITSGHRCPEHNTYVDPSSQNSYSKHLIGAEVSFYVQGMENEPATIVDILADYYKNDSPFKDKEEYFPLQRYEKKDTNVSTPPWYNKEVFIKLFKREEGRNFDNRHPFPYLAIQVRYDADSNERVTYSWEKAYKNYLRR